MRFPPPRQKLVCRETRRESHDIVIHERASHFKIMDAIEQRSTLQADRTEDKLADPSPGRRTNDVDLLLLESKDKLVQHVADFLRAWMLGA